MTIVCKTGHPRVFIDLAADAHRVGPRGQVHLYTEPALPPPMTGLTGTDKAIAVIRAIGVLIGNGQPHRRPTPNRAVPPRPPHRDSLTDAARQ